MQPGGVVPLPTVLGLMVCEQTIIDKDTNNVSLINCFTRKQLERFPSDPQRMSVAAFLVGCVGRLKIDLAVRRLDTLDELFRRSFVAQFSDRLAEVRLLCRFRCSFPVAGAYNISLEAGGDVLAQRRLQFS